ATAIICLTTSGKTANIISGFRPRARIISITQHMDVLNSMEMMWGIQTHMIKPYKTMEDVLTQIDQLMVTHGLAKTGDRVILTLGQPIAQGAKTNSIYVHTINGEQYSKLPDDQLPLRCQADPNVE
ncbi:MAG: pyruvate kinase, partial [Bdellovibrio sp.]|nr:pyruvate kinase [Bdellovibrio sp.]